jgi:hypothetical protein
MSKIDSLVSEYGAKMVLEILSKVGRSLDIDHVKKRATYFDGSILRIIKHDGKTKPIYLLCLKLIELGAFTVHMTITPTGAYLFDHLSGSKLLRIVASPLALNTNRLILETEPDASGYYGALKTSPKNASEVIDFLLGKDSSLGSPFCEIRDNTNVYRSKISIGFEPNVFYKYSLYAKLFSVAENELRRGFYSREGLRGENYPTTSPTFRVSTEMTETLKQAAATWE